MENLHPVGELSLRVVEVDARQSGRGKVRVSPNTLERLALSDDAVISVKGGRQTVAVVVASSRTENEVVEMDGILRENAQASLGENVTIAPATHQLAEKLVLLPLGPVLAGAATRDTRYMLRQLDGRAVVAGDHIRAYLFGTQVQDFTVHEAHPAGPVMVHGGTALDVKWKARLDREGPVISYSDIGGLGRELQQIREMIEFPLKHPEAFSRLGISAPKGVLLHGPPGCGKTLVARAVASETSAYFIHLDGPEVIHKFYGESEENLRRVFQEATNRAPSIVFIDEIDAIAPRREDVHGEVEKRVVAQLLALMDGLKSRGDVVVIGATNIPLSLDPALRRPGRFDREISLSIPDRNGRLEILRIHTRGMPLAEDVDLEHLAQVTHGFVGADLESLCREAAMTALRKVILTLDLAHEEIPYDELLALEVSQRCFLEALKGLQPSAIREVFTEIPDASWDDVGGLKEVKKVLKETVVWPLRYERVFERLKISPAKGVLLIGKPGTGKTLVAKAVARESGVNFISVSGPALVSKWVGESERAIREVFKKAKQASPCIVFFDEIDSLVPTRSSHTSDSNVSERLVSQFLAEMDGVHELRGVVVLGATNRPDLIDRALLRPGRFDVVVELTPPDLEERRDIIAIHIAGLPLAEDVDAGALADMTEGYAGSDIEAICRRAAMTAISELINAEIDSEGLISQFRLTLRHFRRAIDELGITERWLRDRVSQHNKLDQTD